MVQLTERAAVTDSWRSLPLQLKSAEQSVSDNTGTVRFMLWSDHASSSWAV